MKGSLGIVGTMLATAFGIYLLFAIKVPCEVTRSKTETIPLTYENVTPVTIINNEMLWGAIRFSKAQITIRNTDSEAGYFKVNFVIQDGDEILTKTETQEILAGEIKTISTDLPNGDVTVQANVIPGSKEVTRVWTEKTQCSLWEYYPKKLWNQQIIYQKG